MYIEPKLGKGHGHSRSRLDAIVQYMFEINYSQLIKYEILEKLVTYIVCHPLPGFKPRSPRTMARCQKIDAIDCFAIGPANYDDHLSYDS